ncbi:unnamed protein product [Amoebophrya sp. A120]|nr:unnamed protein product [Amoebophrya sp. A120]|eukprot:GSA120T00021580001.1
MGACAHHASTSSRDDPGKKRSLHIDSDSSGTRAHDKSFSSEERQPELGATTLSASSSSSGSRSSVSKRERNHECDHSSSTTSTIMLVELIEKSYKVMTIHNLTDSTLALALEHRLASRTRANKHAAAVGPKRKDGSILLQDHTQKGGAAGASSSLPGTTSARKGFNIFGMGRSEDSIGHAPGRGGTGGGTAGVTSPPSVASSTGSPELHDPVPPSVLGRSRSSRMEISFEKDPRFFKREVSAYYYFTRLLSDTEDSALGRLAMAAILEFQNEVAEEMDAAKKAGTTSANSRATGMQGDESRIRTPREHNYNKTQERRPMQRLRALAERIQRAVEHSYGSEQDVDQFRGKEDEVQLQPDDSPPPQEKVPAAHGVKSRNYTPRKGDSEQNDLTLMSPDYRANKDEDHDSDAAARYPGQSKKSKFSPEHLLWEHRDLAVAKFVCCKCMLPWCCDWYLCKFEQEDAHYSHAVAQARQNVWNLFDVQSYEGAYYRTINLLDEVAGTKVFFPMEVLEKLLLVRTEIKLEAPCTLEGMDQVLPVFICCLLQSKIRHPFFLCNLLLDWLSNDQAAESEGQVVTLLESAATVICSERFSRRSSPTAGSPKQTDFAQPSSSPASQISQPVQHGNSDVVIAGIFTTSTVV